MSLTVRRPLDLDDSYARKLPDLAVPWEPAQVPAPQLIALNGPLAVELGLDPEALAGPEGVAMLAGNATPEGATPVAMAYAGHQFGGYSPRLGDGRALLLGELIDGDGQRRDLHLKGSGRTPFARGADGKAVVGPMLREYVIGEAMHALAIPTTRALAVVATGERITRDWQPRPGAVLTRVAASHLRVGTFQYAAAYGGPDLVRRLADYAIARHHDDVAAADNRYLALLDRVVDLQAALVARWMLVGFIHGVMNTDNMTISGETIDYGPCAFMDAYDPETVFSSIDHGGRYAYGNQPQIAQWNLARLAEALLPLIDDDQQGAIDAATEAVTAFADRYRAAWRTGFGAKLGLTDSLPEEDHLADGLLELLRAQGVDFTSAFRALAHAARGDAAPARALFAEPVAFEHWHRRWRERLVSQGRDLGATAEAMDAVNPLYIPRNHLVEEALAAAEAGDMALIHQLVDAVREPFRERPGLGAFAEPAPASRGAYRTFCGT